MKLHCQLKQSIYSYAGSGTGGLGKTELKDGNSQKQQTSTQNFSQVDSCVQTKPKKAQTSQCRYLSTFTLYVHILMIDWRSYGKGLSP